MSFTAEQTVSLAADLDRKHVAQRSQAGRQLSYIEGWHAISEANRIFGFDGWSSETVDLKCVETGERQSHGRTLQTCTYTARCRVTVYAGERIISREGVGAGHGMDVDAGQSHEKAIKEAETDARKRALMTFGNQFGLALYDKTQANVSDESTSRRGPAIAAQTLALPAPAKPFVDPKWAALGKPRLPPSDLEKAISAGDSASVKAAVLMALSFCFDLETMTAWGRLNGRQSAVWPHMTAADQAAVLDAAGERFDAFKAAKAAKAAAAGADPATGELAA